MEGVKSAPQGQEAMPVGVRSALPGAQEGSGGQEEKATKWRQHNRPTGEMNSFSFDHMREEVSSKNIGGGVLVKRDLAGGQGSALPIGIKTQIYSKPHMFKPPLCDL